MSFLDRPFGAEEPDEPARDVTAIEPAREEALSRVSKDEMVTLENSAARVVQIPVASKAAIAADALIPLGANAAQGVSEAGMAMIRFPEGVGWADLCARKAPEWDGYKLLSSFGSDGKFNEMAGIKRAGLQPAAVANLALQGAAVAVGMAYMNQINEKLDGLQAGIEAIQRDMQRERDAELKATYDTLDRLTLKCEEYSASPEKRQVALQIIEDAQREATKAWNYELECMKDFSAEVQAKKRLSAEKIAEEAEKLSAIEMRAAVAFQLFVMAQQIGMRFEGDYTRQRIETDRQIASRMADGFSSVRRDARLNLSEKISKVGGKPLAIATRSEDDHDAANVVLEVFHKAGKNMNRLNPVRMRAKAKADISKRRARLQDVVSNENAVREIAEGNEKELERMDFAFNEADTIVIGSDNITLFKLVEENAEMDDGSGEAAAQ